MYIFVFKNLARLKKCQQLKNGKNDPSNKKTTWHNVELMSNFQKPYRPNRKLLGVGSRDVPFKCVELLLIHS